MIALSCMSNDDTSSGYRSCRNCNQTCCSTNYCNGYADDYGWTISTITERDSWTEYIFKLSITKDIFEKIFTLKYQLKTPIKLNAMPYIKVFRKDRLIGKREKRIGLKR